jgi:hypothetical protein
MATQDLAVQRLKPRGSKRKQGLLSERANASQSASIAKEKDTLLVFALTNKTKDINKINKDLTEEEDKTKGATEEAIPGKGETQSSKRNQCSLRTI